MPKLTHKRALLFVLFLCFLSSRMIGQVPGVPVGIPVGVAVNITSTYPTPYANLAEAYRSTYLYKAEEFGELQGKEQSIEGLWFEVMTANGRLLRDFTIRIKHVDWESMPFNPDTDGMTVYYGPQEYIEHGGFNYHPFIEPFCWDGVRNILVEVCVTNPIGESSFNAGIPVSSPFPGTMLSWHEWNNLGESVCDSPNNYNGLTYLSRPVTYFDMHPGDIVDMAVIHSEYPDEVINKDSTYVVDVFFKNKSCVEAQEAILWYKWDDKNVQYDTLYGSFLPGVMHHHQFTVPFVADSIGFKEIKIGVDNPLDTNQSNDVLNGLVWVKDGKFKGLDYNGTDFWLAFMANYNNAADLKQYFLVTSPEGANVTVTAPLLGWATSFSLTNKEVYKLDIPVEIAGEITANMKGDTTHPTSFHFESDSEISIYGMSQKYQSTDAFLAIPKRTIGKEYRVISPEGVYNVGAATANNPLLANAPAEFVVVATENNTVVNIIPSNPTTKYEKGDTIIVTLNAGENYLVKARIDFLLGLETGTYDLTGSRVYSDKRISVISGSQCAMVPGISQLDKCNACDFLVEQMMPISSWGTKFVMVDFEHKPGNDIVRIFNGHDLPTTVVISGDNNQTLVIPANEFVDVKFSGGIEINADQSVGIMQMCTGGQCLPISFTDPFMLNNIATEQWGNVYGYATALSPNLNAHFISIIKNSKEGRIALDGTEVDPSIFSQVGNTEFYAGKIPTSRGGHRITGDSTFVVYVYGFGYDDSYGYPASGAYIEPINVPELYTETTSDTLNCIGDTTGVITVLAFDGTPPYRFEWEDGDTNEVRNNLPAGLYRVKVTDDYGYEVWDTAYVVAPDTLQYEIQIDSISCFNAKDGAIEIIVNPPVSNAKVFFENYGETSGIQSLDTGAYPFYIAHGVQCVWHDTVEIIQPEPITLDANLYMPSCHSSSDGSIKVDIAGGTQPIQFSWTTLSIQNQDSIDGLSGKNYPLQITDANQCELDTVLILNKPDVLELSWKVFPVGCFGAPLGKIEAEGAGGYGNYQFILNGTDTNSTGEFNNLDTNTYSLQLTDGRCTSEEWLTITALPSPSFVITTIDEACGLANGEATITGSGGLGTYSYTWVSHGNQKGNHIDGLEEGSYTVKATDGRCETILSFEIDSVPPPNFILQSFPSTCNLNNGKIHVDVKRATGDYSIWKNGVLQVTQDSLLNLATNTYTIGVEDDNCLWEKEVVISNIPTFKILDTLITSPTCNTSNGQIDLRVQEGASKVHYSWKGLSGDTALQSNLSAGVYEVSVFDDECEETLFISIQNIDGPVINFTKVPAHCGNDNGSITMLVTGGSGNYDFTWSHNATLNNPIATGLADGGYNVWVDDGVCPSQLHIDIGRVPEIEVTLNTTPEHCDLGDGSAGVMVQNGSGSYHYDWMGFALDTSIAEQLSQGTYQVSISDEYCVLDTVVVIVETTVPVISHTQQSATCKEDNGSLFLSSSTYNGFSEYHFQSMGNIVSDTINNLYPGNYWVYLTDGLCWDSIQAQVLEITPPSANASITPEHCDLSDGTINISPTGIGQVNVTWEDGTISQNRINLSSGWYVYIVNDDNCTLTDSAFVSEVLPPVITVDSIAPSTCDLQNGYASVVITGDESPYQVSWNTNPVQMGSEAFNLTPKTYEVLAQSSYCNAKIVVTVGSIPKPTITANVEQLAHCGGTKGIVSLNTTNAIAPLQLVWDNIQQNWQDTLYDVTNGWHYFTLVDANCNVEDSIYVPEGNTLKIDSIPTTLETCSNNNANLWIYTSGETGVVKYTANGVVQSNYHYSNLSSGNYNVIVTDDFCTDSAKVHIDEIVAPQASVQVLSQDACGKSVGSAEVIPFDPTLIYEWNGVSHNQSTKNNLSEGVHTLIISNGICDTTMSFEISSYPLHEIIVSTQPDYCENQNGSFTIAVVGQTSPYTVEVNGTSSSIGKHDDLAAGSYQISVVDRFGCEVSETANVLSQEENLVDGEIYIIPEIPLPETYLLLKSRLPDNWQEWEWNVNGNILPDSITPQLYIQHEKDKKRVTLYVISENGCLDSLYQLIVPYEDIIVYIPNAFSPNGDGQNEGFSISGVGIKEVEGYIFNRWGEVIFKFNSLLDIWDGTYKGKTVPIGVYPYRFVITGAGTRVKEFNGHVNVLR